ncbi:MAG TPA: FtsX-like permease family protein [Limnobacter sp.]|uniref:ABC transporter permease n=1 Tax=Limnobacter sp. TaxID=2003368 RepID=UPI002EDAF2CF
MASLSFSTYWLQQSRRASFRILFAALVLAVAAIASVGVFSARIEAALLRDAAQMLGGDLVIETKRNPANSPWQALTQQAPYSTLKKAESVEFPSVLPSDKTDLLVSMKAVGGAYPLRGMLKTQGLDGAVDDTPHGPKPGEVWVDQGVLGSLNLSLGDRLTIGDLQLSVTRTILVEPDRGGGFVNFAPRVMFNQADLAATHLLGMGSRATWRTYFVGPASTLSAFTAQLKPLLTPQEELESLAKGRPEVNGTLTRARDFLSMAALIGTLVACVGIALVSHLFAREQAEELSLLKSLGYTPRHLLRLQLAGLAGLTLITGLLGVGLGWLAHWGLMALLSGLITVELPLAGLYFLPLGMVLSAVLLLGFGAAPTWLAFQAPAVAVLRSRPLRTGRLQLAGSVLLGMVAALVVCLLMVDNRTLALLLFGGFLFTSAVFAGVFWALLKGLYVASRQVAQRAARIDVFQSMARRTSLLVVQGVALSLGLSALLMLSVVQGDLLDRWRAVVPDHAPNRFVFNIQPDQVEGVRSTLSSASEGPVRLYPMVRGRLTSVNQQTITADTYSDQRAQALVQREFNLSFTDQLPSHNRIQAGQWFDPNGKAGAEVSLEKGMAERLGLKLGDVLSFDVAGSPLQATVTSIRDLRWDSMEVNFYVIFPSAVLKDFPQTWITSVYLPPDQAVSVSRQLVREFPNLTVLDTALIIGQLRNILAQVSRAVQFVFLFTVAAGGLVVVACVLTGVRGRLRESALYRAMGASSGQLQRAAWVELALLGGLAGLVAALAAQGLGWGVARFVFEFDYTVSPLYVIAGVLGGVTVSVVFGAWSVRRVCNAPVMQTLRWV